MDKQKKLWMGVLILIAILVILIVIGFASGRQDNGSSDQSSHTGHMASESSPGNTLSSNTQPSSTASSDESDSDQALSLYLKEQDKIMSQMMLDMAVEPSSSASIDFLAGMIPHHQSAIDMSESYLRHGGGHEELAQLAKDIISAQTQEIDQMNQLIREIEDSGVTDSEQEQGYLDAYNQMMSSHEHMHHGLAAQTIDQAFAEGMLMHHQMAVDMAKAILDYSEQDEVVQLAETIIESQEKEIQQMQNILDQLKQ